MTDLDQLLRDTLHRRADGVVDAAAWTAPTAGTKWMVWPAVAAATAVVGLAAGLVALRADDRDTGSAGGDPTAACTTTLPAAWQRAAHRLEPGAGSAGADRAAMSQGDVNVRAVTSTGVGIGETGSNDAAHESIVSVTPSGVRRTLWRLSLARMVLNVDTDGTSAVLAVTAASKVYAQRPAVDDLAVIDLQSGRIRHVLARAPVPAGWIVSWNSTVLQDGVVYVVARPPAATAGTGDVLTFTIATGVYRIVGHAAVDADPMNSPQLIRDIRGVGWRGGSVPNPHVPSALPAFFAATGEPTTYQPVYSDGRAIAWQDVHDPFRVYWRDDNGDVRIVDLRSTMGRAVPAVDGVAGPFVLVAVSERAKQYLLDTRAPAVAGFDVAAHIALSDRGVLRPTTESAGLLLHTARLPELHC